MKTDFFSAATMFLAGALTTTSFAGSRTSNGGDVVVDMSFELANPVPQLYSLDLAEYGRAKKTLMISTSQTVNPFPPGQQLPLAGYQLVKVAVGPLDGMRSNYYWMYDTSDHKTTKILIDAGLTYDWIPKNSAPLVGYTRPDFQVGLVNMFYRIRLISPVFSERLLKRVGELTWIFTDAPLQPVDDENSPISTRHMYQIARNDDGEVRIAKNGWSWSLEPLYECRNDNKNYAVELNATNKIAVIFHEIIYSITRDQGDKDSRRARRANALLFSDEMKDIEKAFKIIFPN